jgi:hypothetical protein
MKKNNFQTLIHLITIVILSMAVQSGCKIKHPSYSHLVCAMESAIVQYIGPLNPDGLIIQSQREMKFRLIFKENDSCVVFFDSKRVLGKLDKDTFGTYAADVKFFTFKEFVTRKKKHYVDIYLLKSNRCVHHCLDTAFPIVDINSHYKEKVWYFTYSYSYSVGE